MNHPIQPVELDSNGRQRFKQNKIVDFLATKFGLNELAALDFPQEDWEQLAQLIGYSLSGFGDLSYVRDETFATASAMADQGVTEDQARIAHLESTLTDVRVAVKDAATCLFCIHPDDLHD